MKKSTLAITAVAVLGAVWSGGAYYTGKVGETEFKRLVEKSNEQLAKQGVNSELKVKLDNFKLDRGVFSSNYVYDVVIKLKDSEFVLPAEGVIYHGPLPLNQLSKFNLMPAMFSTTGQLAKNEKSQFLFDAAQGKNPLVTEATMSYSERLTGVMNIAAMDLKQPNLDLSWADSVSYFDTDKEGVGKNEVSLSKLNVLIKGELLNELFENHDLEAIGIELQNLKANSDLKQTDLANIVVGDFSGSLGSLKYTYHPQGKSEAILSFAFNGINFAYNADKQQNFVNYGVKFDSSSITFKEKDLGKFVFNVKLNHLSANTLNQLFVTSYENKSELQRLGLELLQNQPHLQLSELSLTNAGGKMSAESNIELDKVDFANAMSGKLLSMFKQLRFNAVLDQAALVQMNSTLLQAEDGLAKEEAEVQSTADVEYEVQDWLEQGIFVKNGESLNLTLNLEKEGLNFNGNHIPEDSLAMLILGLMINGF